VAVVSSARTATRRPPAGARRRSATRSGNRRPAGRRPPARRRSRGLHRHLKPATLWPLLLIALVALLAFAWDADQQNAPQMRTAPCTLPSGFTLTAEQWANAQTIAQVAHDRGLPDRAVVIALATAMQESRLRNLDYGDRDSLGLFQQRPSQGWGTPEQVQDPAYAAGKFYDHLVTVPGWDTGDLTTIADSVQRSAYPLAYRKHETAATELTAALRDDDLDCR
jgi:hypothetical protein